MNTFCAQIAILMLAFALGAWAGRRKLEKEIATVAARAAIREADGLPVVGNPMASALIEIDGKEAK